MTASHTTNVIAVDIGNSRMKVGRFAPDVASAANLPLPNATLDLVIDHASGAFDALQLAEWCRQYAGDGARFLVASVHRGAADRLQTQVLAWAKGKGIENEVRRITFRD